MNLIRFIVDKQCAAIVAGALLLLGSCAVTAIPVQFGNFQFGNIAHAHDSPACPAGQHYGPADGNNVSRCYVHNVVQLFDWCVDAENNYPILHLAFDTINPTCDVPYSDRDVCMDAGFKHNVGGGFDLCYVGGTHTSQALEPHGCNLINDGQAQYVFEPDRHYCRCLSSQNTGEKCEIPIPTAQTTLLINEIGKQSPNLQSIYAILETDIDLNVDDANGIFPLQAAVTAGNAQLISILITAGANPELTPFQTANKRYSRFAHYLIANGPVFPWGQVLTMLIAADNAMKSANLSVPYDWNARDHLNNTAINYLPHRFDGPAAPTYASTDRQKALMLKIGAFLRGKGSVCRSANQNHITCTDDGPFCPATSDNVYSCSRACSGFPFRSQDSPVTVAAETSTSCIAEPCSSPRTENPTKWLENSCTCPPNSVLTESGCACNTDGHGIMNGTCQVCPSNTAIRKDGACGSCGTDEHINADGRQT